MNTRDEDYKILKEGANSPDPSVRRQVSVAVERLKHETKKIESMREALVKAHRSGNKEEIADIHDFIKNKSEYQVFGGKKTWR